MSKYKTLRVRPSYYNDGEGSVSIWNEEDETKNIRIIQDNCVINEEQIIKIYDFWLKNPQAKRIYIDKDRSVNGEYEGADSEFTVFYGDDKGEYAVNLAELPAAENAELKEALNGEAERLKQERIAEEIAQEKARAEEEHKEAEKRIQEKLKLLSEKKKITQKANNPFMQYKKTPEKTYNDAPIGTKVEILGGNNEYRIGASSKLVEHNEPGKPVARILIDDGAMFPPDWIGYDSAIPDMRRYFDSPYGKAEKPVSAMFITHCHEDHIGAIVFLAAAKFKLPKIYTSEFTANFIKEQMRNNSVPEEFVPEFEIIRQGEYVEIGDNMKVSPFNIPHSTAGALGFHIGTTLDGKDNAGLVFTGDYHMDNVPFGPSFSEEDLKKFMAGKYVSHILMDSTSATTDMYDENGNRLIPDFNKAVENTVREITKHPEKQIFSPVIARSVQNLAIDIKAAAETGRTILIGSRGLRQAVKDLLLIIRNKDRWVKEKILQIKKEAYQARQKAQSEGKPCFYDEEQRIAEAKLDAEVISDMMRLSSGEKIDLEKVIYNASDLDNTDIQKYLNKYPPQERYMIISGAFAEDKADRKSTLVLMSEQNKATIDKDGKIKGKGDTGHPLFTVDNNTLIMLRQRPIESINGAKHRAVVAKLQSLGATVITNGDTIDTKYQRTGHATREETLRLHKLTMENCKNAAAFADGSQRIIDIAVHGDQEQLPAMLEVVKQHNGVPLLCMNTDAIVIDQSGTYKEQGVPFEQQKWICVQAQCIVGSGSNNLFVFDRCDHNLMFEEHLFTVMNVQARKSARIDGDYMMRKAVEKAEEMVEKEGMSASNIEIRMQKQSKHYKDRRGENTRMTYQEWLEQQESKPKGKFGRKQKKFNRRKGYNGGGRE